MEDEFEELKHRIREAEADLRDAKRDRDRVLTLKFADRMNFLLNEKEELRAAIGRERITTSLAVPAPPAPVPAPPAPVPALVFSAPRWLRWTFILHNLARPWGMLTHGLRKFFVSHFHGRPISGLVRRANKHDYGQCILLCISGEESILQDAEEDVLNLVDESGQPFWYYERENERATIDESFLRYREVLARINPWIKL
jgi:hypothetical protein